MVRNAFKVFALDIALLLGEYFVLQDLQWRAAYASSPHNACGGVCSYTPSFSYNILTQTFSMSGGPLQLVSPVTLDWVQLLAYALIVVNVWFGYIALKARRPKAQATVAPLVPG